MILSSSAARSGIFTVSHFWSRDRKCQTNVSVMKGFTYLSPCFFLLFHFGNIFVKFFSSCFLFLDMTRHIFNTCCHHSSPTRSRSLTLLSCLYHFCVVCVPFLSSLRFLCSRILYVFFSFLEISTRFHLIFALSKSYKILVIIIKSKEVNDRYTAVCQCQKRWIPVFLFLFLLLLFAFLTLSADQKLK